MKLYKKVFQYWEYAGGISLHMYILEVNKLDEVKSCLDYSNVIIDEDSELAHIIASNSSPQRFWANHTQIVSEVGDSSFLHNVAYIGDQIVATESKFGVPIKTFQFHPEMQGRQTTEELERNNKIFKSFVKTCNNYKIKKANLDNIISNTPQIITKHEDSIVENNLSVKKLQNFSAIIKEISFKNSLGNKYLTIEEIEENSKLLQQLKDIYSKEEQWFNIGITTEQFLPLIRNYKLNTSFDNNINKIESLINIKLITIQELLTLNETQKKILINNSASIKRLVDVGITIEKLFKLEKNQQELFIDNCLNIKYLVDTGITLEQLLGVEITQQRLLIENSHKLKDLTEDGIITIEQLLDMEIVQQQLLFVNSADIKKLFNAGITVEKLFSVEKVPPSLFIRNSSSIEQLVDAGITVEKLLDMETTQQLLFFKNSHKLKNLTEDGIITIEQLLDMKITQQQLLFVNSIDIKILFNTGITIEKLFSMQKAQQSLFMSGSNVIKQLVNYIAIEKLLVLKPGQQELLIEHIDDVNI